MLSIDDFKQVVSLTPLISIDLIIRNSEGKVLLGKRNNRPAKGYWFVPGGRILKDESVDCAFTRLLRLELGVDANNVKARFLGVYQHFYDDNFSDNLFSTHYVVLSYEMKLDNLIAQLPADQHNEYCWFSEEELVHNNDVHKHTKWYFQQDKMADFPLVEK